MHLQRLARQGWCPLCLSNDGSIDCQWTTHATTTGGTSGLEAFGHDPRPKHAHPRQNIPLPFQRNLRGRDTHQKGPGVAAWRNSKKARGMVWMQCWGSGTGRAPPDRAARPRAAARTPGNSGSGSVPVIRHKCSFILPQGSGSESAPRPRLRI
jgi:hypothetical protein